MDRSKRLVRVGLAALAVMMLTATSTAAQGTPAVQAPIQVLHGPNGQALVVANVTIQGHPYGFIVDSGASGSLISRKVARRLSLPKAGRLHRTRGVGGTSVSQAVRIESWKLTGPSGDIPLAPRQVDSQRFNLGPGVPAIGLLGSDVLSAYGKVSIDYAHGVLTLGG